MKLTLAALLFLSVVAFGQEYEHDVLSAVNADPTSLCGGMNQPACSIVDIVPTNAAIPTKTVVEADSNTIIRPYILGGLDLNGGGYQPAAAIAGMGFAINNPRFIFEIEGLYDNSKKVNDGTGQSSGFSLRAKTNSFAKLQNGWFFGGGIRYSDLDTQLYSKHAWRPQFGGGRDVIADTFSFRLQGVYILPGSDHLNGVQGPEISFWMPSPAKPAHLFFREVLAPLIFHNEGQSSHSVFTELQMTIVYRF